MPLQRKLSVSSSQISIQSGNLPFDRPSSNNENFPPLCTTSTSNINSRPTRNVVATITTSFMFHHHTAIRRFSIPSPTASSHCIFETGASSDVPEKPEHLFLLLIASSHRMGASADITKASDEVVICSETLTGISNACSLLCRHLPQPNHLPRWLACATGDGSESSGAKPTSRTSKITKEFSDHATTNPPYLPTNCWAVSHNAEADWSLFFLNSFITCRKSRIASSDCGA